MEEETILNNDNFLEDFSFSALLLPKDEQNIKEEIIEESNNNINNLEGESLFNNFPDYFSENASPTEDIFNFENNNNNLNSDNNNLFSEINPLFANNEPWNVFDAPSSSTTLETNLKKEEIKAINNNVKKEEEGEETSGSPVQKKQKTTKNAPQKKKKKSELTPEEIEAKKKEQLERRLVKNRRTADISRKRKKAKKITLEESLANLKEEAITLDKQAIELSAENRVLKAELLAMFQLIKNTPKLSKMFDKIGEIAVSQPPEKLLMANTASAASVYILNIIYSIHQSWNIIKSASEQTINNNSNPNALPNIAVN